jgi:hypothetical protein
LGVTSLFLVVLRKWKVNCVQTICLRTGCWRQAGSQRCHTRPIGGSRSEYETVWNSMHSGLQPFDDSKSAVWRRCDLEPLKSIGFRNTTLNIEQPYMPHDSYTHSQRPTHIYNIAILLHLDTSHSASKLPKSLFI